MDKNNPKQLDESGHGIVYSAFIARTLPGLLAKQRALAYASEVGESFRPLVKQWIVRSAYGASFLYVGADTYIKAREVKDSGGSNKQIALKAGDMLIFHSFASMLFPAITIHTIVKYSRMALVKFPKIHGWGPTIIGLLSIPFIIHPIDHGTEWVMDRTSRRIMKLHSFR